MRRGAGGAGLVCAGAGRTVGTGRGRVGVGAGAGGLAAGVRAAAGDVTADDDGAAVGVAVSDTAAGTVVPAGTGGGRRVEAHPAASTAEQARARTVVRVAGMVGRLWPAAVAPGRNRTICGAGPTPRGRPTVLHLFVSLHLFVLLLV